MNEWTRFYRGDCPVCQGRRKDCRQNRNNQLVHCRVPVNEIQTNFHYVGEDKLGFNMWSETQGKRKKIPSKILPNPRRKRRSLLVHKRHEQITQLLSQLTLNRKHYQDLRKRGLTQQQIQEGHYRSVTYNQPLKNPLHKDLAGLDYTGRHLICPSGLLCPFSNEKGKWLGWQIRLDRTSPELPKYLWAASEKWRNPKPSIHLPNQELPLAVWFPSSPSSYHVGFTEGVSIKPQIAAEKTHYPILGSAGGFREHQQISRILKALSPSYLTIFPDGGDVQNPQVMRKWESLYQILSEQGWAVNIAWWGQTAQGSDIDEVPHSEFEVISFYQFLQLRSFNRSQVV